MPGPVRKGFLTRQGKVRFARLERMVPVEVLLFEGVLPEGQNRPDENEVLREIAINAFGYAEKRFAVA